MTLLRLFTCCVCAGLLLTGFSPSAQEGPVHPALTGRGTYHGLTPPLRSLPVLTEEEFRTMEKSAYERNAELQHRSYPYAATALPAGPDPAWQREMGRTPAGRGVVMNFSGQQSPYYPSDANGAAGPAYYMQAINTVYCIYEKASGAIVAGPSGMNTLFSGVPGANCNDGDPLVLYDEQAGRWLAVEFSICSSNDRMLVAVSQTEDPAGSWHVYSFDVADMPDYEKFGIWRDGYYMGTNNALGNDIYVFEREQMLAGGEAQFAGFNNPWRPATIDGFMCVPPLDNDGPAAPAGTTGLFITINDDAVAGGADQLWIYELGVDWANLSNSAFTRSQRLDVPAFDSDFGFDWDNIRQPGTSQQLDAIPMVVMNRPQYRNFGSYETIVCCHTVDLDNTDHAGIRWYELRRAGGAWSIRQSGTYGPDEHNRWMGSIALNGQHEIGMAYSVSSSTVYPGLRFCGQSAAAYAAATGEMDVTEETIQAGSFSQEGTNRWGDYFDVSVDPLNDRTFWFTGQYVGEGGSRLTRIASFEFGPQPLVAMFSVSNHMPCHGYTVTFTDQSAGSPLSWSWTFEGGTPGTSAGQNPAVTYTSPGVYDVRLVVSDGISTDTLFMEDFIRVVSLPGRPDAPSGPAEACRGAEGVKYFTHSVESATAYDWQVSPPEAGTFSSSDTTGHLDIAPGFTGQLQVSVAARNDCGGGTPSQAVAVSVYPGPARFSVPADGGYCFGDPGFEMTLDGSETGVTYELFRDGVATGIVRQGTGSPLSFGMQSATGSYTVAASNDDCTVAMNGSTSIYYMPVPEIAYPPTGPKEICNSVSGAGYTTPGAPNATYYLWHLYPPEAGVISGTGTTATVEWDPEFTGNAGIFVQGAGECGTGLPSDILQVSVLGGPHPAVTGQEDPCTSSTGGKVYFYSTALHAGDDYFWQVEGGNLSAGQGTRQVMVNWSLPGDGRVILIQTSLNGCSAADTLAVHIHDCTGIPEAPSGSLVLWPVPAEDKLTVRAGMNSPGPVRMVVCSSTGLTVLQEEFLPGGGQIDLTFSTSGLAAGVYSLRLIATKGEVMKGKFVVVR